MPKSKSSTYTLEVFNNILKIAHDYHNQLKDYNDILNKEQMLEDINDYGPIDQYLKYKLHATLMDIAKLSSAPFDWFLTVQEGFYTAVDALVFFYNVQENRASQLLIIKRPDGKLAPIGGFTRYGETPEQTAVREALEETNIVVAWSTLRLLGVYAKPDRDPRPKHIVSLAYIGLTQDWPAITGEATNVYGYTYEEIKATESCEWFAKDHRQMALESFEKLKDHYNSMIKELQKAP